MLYVGFLTITGAFVGYVVYRFFDNRECDDGVAYISYRWLDPTNLTLEIAESEEAVKGQEHE